jgi:glycosyltransferase involved in cell wall biosynthesis
MPKISVIIPVRNRQNLTRNILYQIFSQIYGKNYRNLIDVIVVDDGSTDRTRQIIRNEFPDVHLIEGNGTLWWTGAIVKGMKYALENLQSTEYIVWLNDDISLSDNFISNLVEICDQPFAKASVIGGIVLSSIYSDWIVFSGLLKKQPIRSMDKFLNHQLIEVDTLNGNITVISRKIVEDTGLPDCNKFKHYGGDYEFTNRAKLHGFKVFLSSQLKAKTDYTVDDVIRYMPPWIQGYLEPHKKMKILQGFTSYKTNYNIWHMVNIIYGNHKKITLWQYVQYYIRQVIKLLLSDILIKDKIAQELQNYLKQQNVPAEMAETILDRIPLKS